MKPGIIVSSDIEELSRNAAKILIDTMHEVLASRESVSVAVSGGSTPAALFSLLASDGYREKIDWGRIHLFWVDERCVPPESGDSNFGNAHRFMLSKIPIPPENIHRIKGELTPEDGAQRYEEDIRRYFEGTSLPAFDLVFLGIGEDGHTASLFPGYQNIWDQQRSAVPLFVEKLKSWRITLTLPAINNACRVVFLVSGKSKAAIINEVLGTRAEGPSVPAAMVSPVTGTLTWLVDQEASSTLDRNENTDR